MAKLAGGIDSTVAFIEAVIQVQPMLKFQRTGGKETTVRDLAGLARSIQAASSVSLGRSIEEATSEIWSDASRQSRRMRREC